MILEVSWEGVWTLSFGPSQFHGHGSWLVCEVALIPVISEDLNFLSEVFRKEEATHWLVIYVREVLF